MSALDHDAFAALARAHTEALARLRDAVAARAGAANAALLHDDAAAAFHRLFAAAGAYEPREARDA